MVKTGLKLCRESWPIVILRVLCVAGNFFFCMCLEIPVKLIMFFFFLKKAGYWWLDTKRSSKTVG